MKQITITIAFALVFGNWTIAQSDSNEVKAPTEKAKKVTIKVEEIDRQIESLEEAQQALEEAKQELSKMRMLEERLESLVEVEEEIEFALKDIEEIKPRVKKEPKFIETHFSTFHLGFNNLMNNAGELKASENYPNMSLSAGNSIHFQWDIINQSLNLYRDKIRLMYGVGLEFNNYRFEKNIDLQPDSVPLMIVENPTTNYKRNKLVTQFVNVPLMLNIKLKSKKKKNDHVHLAAGANLGYLIGSHQKQVWNDGGKKKNKTRDNFNLEQYRIGYEVQFGYNNLILYGKYFPNSIFSKNEGPELRSVSAGFLIGFS